MTRHSHKTIKVRDIARNYYGVTKDLKEPAVITSKGIPQFTLTPVNNLNAYPEDSLMRGMALSASAQTQPISEISLIGTKTNHLCQDFCVQCNPTQVLDYLKEEVNKHDHKK